MASGFDVKSRVEIENIVLCPICLELIDDPRSLPCLHTFCLKCIKRHYVDKLSGDDVVCPVCRKEFQIPRKGLDELVHNFFIQSLVDARKSEVATHSAETRGSYCNKHKNKRVKLYCFDCKSNICMMCYAVGHRQHECKEITELKEVYVKQIEADLLPISKLIGDIHKAADSLKTEGDRFYGEIVAVEKLIEQKTDELKQLIDRQVTTLKEDLQSVKKQTRKEIESHKERVDMTLLALESFNVYCSELKTKGKPCDITGAADGLHVRALELLKTDVTSLQYHAPCITFTAMNIDELTSEGENLIGQLETKDGTSG